MVHVLVTAGGGQVRPSAAALANVFGADVRPLPVAPDDNAETARRLLAELADPAAIACALGASVEQAASCWTVMTAAEKPVLLVPPGLAVPPPPKIGRVLLPLDGGEGSAAAVHDLSRLLITAGAELLVLHVFDAASVPMFWDQHPHAHRAWTNEFLHRAGTPPGTRVELCSGGSAAEHVLHVAQRENVDLIALGWSRRFDRGRARTVREAVLNATVPVLLLPADRAGGPDGTNG